jgi:hypothetical protein
MLVRERMKALGDHAKSSRQPPAKERKYANAAESAAKQDTIDETILENSTTHDSAVAVVVDDVTPQIAVHANGNDGAVVEITPSEDASEISTAESAAAEAEAQLATADDSATQASGVQEDDATSAAKRAIIHEWENWSALHSDELNDPNVAEYFFKHLEAKKSHLLDFGSQDNWATVRKLCRDR